MTPNDPTDPNDPTNNGDAFTPPENPYAEPEPEQAYEEAISQQRRRPVAASGSGKVVIFAFGMLALGVFVLYKIFFSGDDEKAAPPAVLATAPATTEVAPAPATSTPVAVPSAVPQAPPPPPPPPPVSLETPAVVEAPPPPPPPSMDDVTALPTLPEARSSSAIDFNDKERQKRLRSGLLVQQGEGVRANAKSEAEKAGEALGQQDPNRAFSDKAISASSAQKTQATRMTNLRYTIAQGKIIEGVLETAVNTDLPGTLRSIISRDVYAESGKEILIPKGSRLIGTYNTGILRGQRRVFIVWTRVLKPDGIDIAIGSPGVDTLGRAGMEGHVDNKYFEVFSGAILTSIISIGTGAAADSVSDTQSTSTTNSNGTTTTGNTSSAATRDAVANFGDVSRSIVEGVLDLRPTITIDQGTRMNVFVNRDLIFPAPQEGAVFVQ